METDEPKRCLRCGTYENITKDHVVSKFVLRTVLSRQQYKHFCRLTGKSTNIQPLCRDCNEWKGHRCIDYRGRRDAQRLSVLLEAMGADSINIKVVDTDV